MVMRLRNNRWTEYVHSASTSIRSRLSVGGKGDWLGFGFNCVPMRLKQGHRQRHFWVLISDALDVRLIAPIEGGMR